MNLLIVPRLSKITRTSITLATTIAGLIIVAAIAGTAVHLVVILAAIAGIAEVLLIAGAAAPIVGKRVS